MKDFILVTPLILAMLYIVVKGIAVVLFNIVNIISQAWKGTTNTTDVVANNKKNIAQLLLAIGLLVCYYLLLLFFGYVRL